MSAPPRRRAGSLQDLKQIKRDLEAAAREAAAREAEQRARDAASRRERELFATSVGPVLPLKARTHTPPPRPKPEPLPLQRQRDEQAALQEALSDDFDVESLLDTDEALSWRRPGVGPDVVRKLRRGVWAIQAQVDLHGLQRDAARERLAAFLRDAARHGLRCVRVVHGKGNSSPGRQPVLKGKVRAWLVQKVEVMAFAQARAAEGGAGALVVLLDSAGAAG
ncbi:Smr/MutS family protein [uncultured Methylibium sp.]|uniref:Smr/MutS family protein n=1 Tax=uncultured Methylibium sp. TaxID=381093 RepID=UPI0025DE97E9|nr:Smr/MutS family protein [uncultured Methylibium sp.]